MIAESASCSQSAIRLAYKSKCAQLVNRYGAAPLNDSSRDLKQEVFICFASILEKEAKGHQAFFSQCTHFSFNAILFDLPGEAA